MLGRTRLHYNVVLNGMALRLNVAHGLFVKEKNAFFLMLQLCILPTPHLPCILPRRNQPHFLLISNLLFTLLPLHLSIPVLLSQQLTDVRLSMHICELFKIWLNSMGLCWRNDNIFFRSDRNIDRAMCRRNRTFSAARSRGGFHSMERKHRHVLKK